MRLSCDSARVIRIVRANYGRLGPAVCPPRPPAPPTRECLHRATKTVLDRVCGGRGSCGRATDCCAACGEASAASDTSTS